MKTIYLICFVLVFLSSCKKDSTDNTQNEPGLPTVVTNPITNYTSNSAEGGGTITDDGGSPIVTRGVCWAAVNPTVSDNKTTDGTGTGIFVSSLMNLNPNTYYAVRAYATNSVGTAYGDVVGMATAQQLTIPTVIAVDLQSPFSNMVHMQADVTDSGHASVTTRGVCWSTSHNPTLSNNVIPEGTGFGYYGVTINGLSVNTAYYFRAYATNSVGTGYSEELSVTTQYHIGEGIGGGRIFFIDGTGLHGLVAAVSDQSGGARWNNTSNPYAPINAYSMSNGVTNTTTIIFALANPNHAAAICRAYNGGGYTDWYLPSINELYQLFLNQSVFGNFQPTQYWSSTASSTWDANAWAQDFGGGTSFNDQDKTELKWVRAIRAF